MAAKTEVIAGQLISRDDSEIVVLGQLGKFFFTRHPNKLEANCAKIVPLAFMLSLDLVTVIRCRSLMCF